MKSEKLERSLMNQETKKVLKVKRKTVMYTAQ